MGTGWALEQWGRGPWGGGTSPFAVALAEAVATRTIRVTLTLPPLATSAAVLGDALNPKTWTVTRLDSGAAYTVLGAELVSTHDVDVLLLGPLAAYVVQHRITANGLLASNGSTPIGAPNYGDFAGLVTGAVPGQFDKDVANPPVTGPSTQGFGGTLLVVGGDYALEQGDAFVKKMAYRDLFTEPGGFAHLPGYGFGLVSKVKQGLRPNQIPQLAEDIGRALKSRPWVDDAKARLAFDSSNGILAVLLLIRSKGSQSPVKFPLQVSATGQVTF